DMAAKAYVGVADGQVVGAGGLAWGAGRCWIWLQTFGTEKTYPIQVIRWARRLLRVAAQLGERKVFTPRDDEHDTSEKLLRLLGFEFVEIDPTTGKEI